MNVSGKGYDFVQAGQFMQWTDSALEAVNPGASRVLVEADIQLQHMAYKLSQIIPSVISVGALDSND